MHYLRVTWSCIACILVLCNTSHALFSLPHLANATTLEITASAAVSISIECRQVCIVANSLKPSPRFARSAAMVNSHLFRSADT